MEMLKPVMAFDGLGEACRGLKWGQDASKSSVKGLLVGQGYASS